MSPGGFGLFVPFLPPVSGQSEESGPGAVASVRAISSSDSSSSSESVAIVKHEPADDVIDHLLLPPPADDVITGTDQKPTEDANSSLPVFDWHTATATAAVDAVDDDQSTSAISRTDTVFSAAPDVLEAAGTSFPSCSSERQARAAFSKELATGERASSGRHGSVRTSDASTTLAAPKVVESRCCSQQQPQRQAPRLTTVTTSEINREIRKRLLTSKTAENQRSKRARNDDQVKSSTRAKMARPAVVPTSTAGGRRSPWVYEKKLIIPSPQQQPPVGQRRRGRPPKRRIDTVVMPPPDELRHQPAARRKILALYRSSQFTPLDGSKRENASVACRRPATDVERPGCVTTR